MFSDLRKLHHVANKMTVVIPSNMYIHRNPPSVVSTPSTILIYSLSFSALVTVPLFSTCRFLVAASILVSRELSSSYLALACRAASWLESSSTLPIILSLVFLSRPTAFFVAVRPRLVSMVLRLDTNLSSSMLKLRNSFSTCLKSSSDASYVS